MQHRRLPRPDEAQREFAGTQAHLASMNATSPSRNLYASVLQALNGIRRPSTAAEITDRLNAQPKEGEKPFNEREVSQQLRNMGDSALTLFWLRLVLGECDSRSNRTGKTRMITRETPRDLSARNLQQSYSLSVV